MDHFLYTAMSGAKQIFYAQQSNANNLANAQTTGFKQDLADARAMPVFGPGMPTRVYSMTERPTSDFNPGGFITTGRDLDVAVQSDDGFFSVLDKKGQEAYTRMGEFKINEAGVLTTMTGLPILGDGGPIVLPPADKIDIGSDGTITIHPSGEPQNVTAVVGQLKLVKPALSDMKKNEDGLFVRKDGQILPPDLTVKVLSGGLEGSNVNAVEAMTSMIDLQRQYEMQAKMLKTAKDMEQASSQLLRA
ncbi:MAG: flagellar basal body rod protein FlgF [Gammaproteobacteria bacterium]|nr:flagellar basal body rod protein FlgF [Gammaproteobacteria bacterium]